MGIGIGNGNFINSKTVSVLVTFGDWYNGNFINSNTISDLYRYR